MSSCTASQGALIPYGVGWKVSCGNEASLIDAIGAMRSHGPTKFHSCGHSTFRFFQRGRDDCARHQIPPVMNLDRTCGHHRYGVQAIGHVAALTVCSLDCRLARSLDPPRLLRAIDSPHVTVGQEPTTPVQTALAERNY